MKKILFAVLLVMIPAMLFVKVSAQVGFTNFTSLQGLVDDFVTGGVAIDANNVKWFGTQSGLSKYDDENWQSFDTDDGLVDNYIQCIAIDNSLNVWIGTENGVSKYNGSIFTNYTTADGLPENSILDIACDNSGNVWLASFSGLTKFNGTDFQNYTSSDGMSSDFISCITVSGENLYIGTFGAGLMVYNGSTFTPLTTENGLLDNNISALATDSEGHLWVGSYYGITVLDNSYSVSVTYTLNNGLINNYVQDIAIDDNDNVIVCEYADYLQDGGISLYNGSVWENYTVSDGLVNAMVKRVVFDGENFAWITTGGGVSKMDTDAGIMFNESFEAFVYPNPVKDVLYLSNGYGSISYCITDISGKIIDQNSDFEGSSINFNNISKGIYLISYKFEDNVFSSKIIKE
ncbi:MAG TPA: two-component regulator propeller domain-containing protein [Bacteroidales bacterium]|nr:two-component regulator propeller domain-containing protein [Bacteroidales bacterium]